MSVSTTLWNPPVNYESQFEKDLACEDILPACRRLALYVCKMLCKDTTSTDANGLSDADVDGFTCALFSMSKNENASEYTRAEVALLYDVMLGYFDARLGTEETLSIHWRVDYAPDGEFAQLLSHGKGVIRAFRESCTPKEPELPKNWGFGAKCSYVASNGCACVIRCYGKPSIVINNQGDVFDKDPWVTFYESDDPVDEIVAKTFKPKCDVELKEKFINRDIVRKMGYTFEKDGVWMAKTKNWGILSYLIESVGSDISHETGHKVMNIAAKFGCIQYEIIRQLLKVGVPIIDVSEGYPSCSDPLYLIISEASVSDLFDFLKDLKSVPRGVSKDVLHYFCGSVSNFLKHIHDDNRVHNAINQLFLLWVKLNKEGQSTRDLCAEFVENVLAYNKRTRYADPKYYDWLATSFLEEYN